MAFRFGNGASECGRLALNASADYSWRMVILCSAAGRMLAADRAPPFQTWILADHLCASISDPRSYSTLLLNDLEPLRVLNHKGPPSGSLHRLMFANGSINRAGSSKQALHELIGNL